MVAGVVGAGDEQPDGRNEHPQHVARPGGCSAHLVGDGPALGHAGQPERDPEQVRGEAVPRTRAAAAPGSEAAGARMPGKLGAVRCAPEIGGAHGEAATADNGRSTSTR